MSRKPKPCEACTRYAAHVNRFKSHTILSDFRAPDAGFGFLTCRCQLQLPLPSSSRAGKPPRCTTVTPHPGSRLLPGSSHGEKFSCQPFTSTVGVANNPFSDLSTLLRQSRNDVAFSEPGVMIVRSPKQAKLHHGHELEPRRHLGNMSC